MTEAFSARVRRLRLARRHTQRSLASLVGVSRNHLWRLEHDDYKPGFDTLKRLASALGVTTDYLQFGRGADESQQLVIIREQINDAASDRCCPCCSHALFIEEHRPGSPWTLRQTAFIHRARAAGMPAKVVGRLFGVSGDVINKVYSAGGVFIPRITATVVRPEARL